MQLCLEMLDGNVLVPFSPELFPTLCDADCEVGQYQLCSPLSAVFLPW